ncbi:LAFA_0G14004g1_1 [Lachancea sp. 'fantastica']|nr:LAFA_0G14004g1_1 [Lachancea sp. 'fantastica']
MRSIVSRTLYICLQAFSCFTLVTCSSHLKFAFQAVDCPDTQLIREAKSTLCADEDNYIASRQLLMKGRLKDFIETTGLRASDVTSLSLLAQDPINVGLAISGGGLRSMLTGSGFMLKMEEYGLLDCVNYVSGTSGGSWILAKLALNDFKIDSLADWDITESILRGVPDTNVSESGVVTMLDVADLKEIFTADEWFFEKLSHVPKLLSRSTKLMQRQVSPFDDFFSRLEEHYTAQISKLSKRGPEVFSKIKHIIQKLFVVTKEADSNVEKMVDSSHNFAELLEFYVDLHRTVRAKKLSGFPLSFTDYWGHALINGIAPQAGQTSLSTLVEDSKRFREYKTPFPIIVANCKNNNMRHAVFEFTPFEFGSWTNLRLFMRLKYLGSTMKAGEAKNCYTGFDEISFITATSSSIFNNVLMCIWQVIAPSIQTRKAIGAILSAFSIAFENSGNKTSAEAAIAPRPEYAIYHPNPFYQYPGSADDLKKESRLYLVDGGEDGQNIPIGPLLIPERKLDVILALDSSSDIDGYPNGSMLHNFYRDNYIATHENMLEGKSSPYQLLPYIPTSEEFVEKRLLSHPIAFGCHLSSYPDIKIDLNSNLTSMVLPPIILYHANAEHSFKANVSTFKLRFTHTEVAQMLNNGRDIFSFDSSPKYKRCLACLLVKRAHDRHQLKSEPTTLPFFCEVCFSDYCFN